MVPYKKVCTGNVVDWKDNTRVKGRSNNARVPAENKVTADRL